MKKLKKKVVVLSAVACIAAASSVAQNPKQQVPQQQTQSSVEVTDGDLENVVEIQKEVQVINKEAQPKMIKAIEDVGLETEKYMEINKAVQQSADTDAFEESTLEKYKAAQESIAVIQKSARKKMTKKIKDVGYTEQEYSQIYMAIQQDPELQKKVQALMGKS